MPQKKIPRYRAIADELINAIVARRYLVGGALPAEAELCEQLGASRHTIREALRILEEAGLISRRQGSGSEVIASAPPVRYRQNVDHIEDLLQFGQTSRFAVLGSAEVEVGGALAESLGCAPGSRCIELRCLRSERGEHAHEAGLPVAVSHITFAPQPARRRQRLLDPATSLATLLEALDARTLGHIEQTFDAVALDTEAAALLQSKKGSPSLRAHRRYFDRQGRLILVAISWHHVDRFRHHTVLRHEFAA